MENWYGIFYGKFNLLLDILGILWYIIYIKDNNTILTTHGGKYYDADGKENL